ncbi:hypothetical protein TWF730_009030 [Orbilia blumenaviensis]|uniref:U three protein 23 n=1 Tax=Orbilia blumenaviensis TaxID=1796055 RepID=A0AAV9UY20_9PEZI
MRCQCCISALGPKRLFPCCRKFLNPNLSRPTFSLSNLQRFPTTSHLIHRSPASHPIQFNMRAGRSKAYKKLMAVYANSFGFREPYQVLVDPTIIQDAMKYKMDLAVMLERTLQGKAKPMITQCCIRHLYATDNQPLINLAKTFERRRCNHSISDDPLSALECMLSVVIPSEDAPIPNKHRYVVATDDQDMREKFREYPGVPGIHIIRSVMVLDQISDATSEWRENQEKGKLRSGLKDRPSSKKRKREKDEDGDEEVQDGDGSGSESDDKSLSGAPEKNNLAAKEAPRKKKIYGKQKQPNPLSVMKKKKKPPTKVPAKTSKGEGGELPKTKRKRKRTHVNSGSATGDTKDVSGDTGAQTET